jgi:hypothetical protein
MDPLTLPTVVIPCKNAPDGGPIVNLAQEER